MEIQRIQNSQNDLKKNKVRRIIQPNLKAYYKATIVKTVWYQHKEKREREKQKAQEQTQTYGQLVFNKGAKDESSGKGESFPQMVLKQLNSHLQKKNKNLNTSEQITVKLLEENIGENLEDPSQAKISQIQH